MQSKRFILNSADGFTVIELMVASVIGLLVLAMLLSSTISSKNLFQADVVRTRINQDLRGALDIIGSQARVAGENLTGAFPAIIIEDNWNGTGSDRLILRRNLLDEVIKSCVDITSGSAAAVEMVTSGEPGCSYTDNTHNFTTWHDYRESIGGSSEAYIFNSVTKTGEFFTYSSDVDEQPDDTTGFIGRYALYTDGSAWQNNYDSIASAVYLLEEWEFRLLDGNLQLIVNGDTQALNVTAGIGSFEVMALLQDGTELTDFDTSQDWTDLRAIRITMVGTDTYLGKPLERTLSAEYFPRNVLSN